MKRFILTMLTAVMIICVTACSQKDEGKQTVNILAAASLTDVMGELESNYESEHSDVDLVFSFAGSGALQTQIEEGAPCDIFLSAAMKQMNALRDEDLMNNDSIIQLLENKLVLIVPEGNDLGLTSFEDVVSDEVDMIAIGDPESVPAGQYAVQVFETLGILQEIEDRANYGTDVRTVLTWVEEGEVDCGIVYATDAFTGDSVEIICEAPEGSCDQVIYPAGITASCECEDEAADFIDYLLSDEAASIFESYGFTMVD